MIDGKKIAVIHIAKAQLGLSDGEYRDVLESACGVRSAKDIADDDDFKAVMKCFETLGYVNERGPQRLHTRQWYKAMWLWGELHKRGAARHPNAAALRAFIRKITPHGNTTEGMSRVIEHLKKWLSRVKKNRGAR